jgi:dTDP-4-amino-4,6-dideoxygalactose transaminase
LDAVQIAFVRAKLPFVDNWTEKRRAHAAQYRRALSGVDLELPAEAPRSRHSYYRFAVRTPHRTLLKRWLNQRGIRTATSYSPCLHLTRTYADLGHAPGSFPKAEAADRDTLLLPISPFLTEEERNTIEQAVLSFYAARS